MVWSQTDTQITNRRQQSKQVKAQLKAKVLGTCVGLGVLVFLGSPIAVASESASISSEIVKTGYEFLEKGWVDAAVEAFDQALQQDSASAKARLGLAIAYQRNGQIEAAWQKYQSVLQINPAQPDALRAVGTMASYRPEWQRQGIIALARLLKQQPGDLAIRQRRALLYFYQGQLDEALEDYEVVLAREDARQRWTNEDLLGAAQVLTYRDRPTQALTLFNRYQQQFGSIPDSSTLANARALYKTGRAEQAISILSARLAALQARLDVEASSESTAEPIAESTAVQPEQFQLELIQAHLANQQPEQALGIYEHLVQQFPQRLPLRIRQLALAQTLEHLCSADVLEALQQHWTQLPGPPKARQELAQALVALEPHAEFLGLYQDLIETPVDAPFLHFRIAQMQAQEGSFDAAQQSLERYAAQSGQDRSTAELFQAELYRRQGAFSQSEAVYQAVLAKDSQNIAAQAGLGGLALQQQAFTQAQQHFNQVLQSEPAHVMARASLAEIKAAQGQPITALRELEQLAQGPCSQTEQCDLKRRSQQIRQRLHRQRGFQPPWERY